MSVAAVRDYLNHGHHLKLKQNLETVLSTLHGHPLRIQPHFTPSVLSSATLTTSYIKNFLIRNQESINGGSIRRILNLTDYKHAAWKYNLDQSYRKAQYEAVLKGMEFEEQKLVTLLKFKRSDAGLLQKLAQVQENVKQVKMTIKLMKDTVTGSLHPEPRNNELASTFTSAKTESSTSTSAGSDSPLKIRGLLIKLAGPRKGNRAMKWEKSVGAVSTNSVDYVIAEESKVQIPSKLGIFGLYVRIVYQKLAQNPTSIKKNPGDLEFFNGISLFKPF